MKICKERDKDSGKFLFPSLLTVLSLLSLFFFFSLLPLLMCLERCEYF